MHKDLAVCSTHLYLGEKMPEFLIQWTIYARSNNTAVCVVSTCTPMHCATDTEILSIFCWASYCIKTHEKTDSLRKHWQAHSAKYSRQWQECRQISHLHVRLNIHYLSSYPLTSHITSCSDLCESQMVTLATGDCKKPIETVLQCAITEQIN